MVVAVSAAPFLRGTTPVTGAVTPPRPPAGWPPPYGGGAAVEIWTDEVLPEWNFESLRAAGSFADAAAGALAAVQRGVTGLEALRGLQIPSAEAITCFKMAVEDAVSDLSGVRRGYGKYAFPKTGHVRPRMVMQPVWRD
jgi:hypothetical protein